MAGEGRMTEPNPVELTEDRVPADGIEEGIEELVDLYGGAITAEREGAREFTLPLRRGFASGGAVECTLSWASDDEGQATIQMRTNRNVDAPKLQRVLFLLA